MTLQSVISKITPADAAARAECARRWDLIAHPLGSLGLLERQTARLAGVFGTADLPDLRPRAVVAMCADNGVVAQGVTQSPQEVTAQVTENFSRGTTCMCRMAKQAGARVIPVDIGVCRPCVGENILDRCVIRGGTRDMSQGPAMTREEAEKAILVGVALAGELAQKGYRLLATGEMGIGNTTSSSALAAVLLGKAPEEVTGRGAGLTSAGLERKIAVIRQAIGVNAPDPTDPLDCLHKVGGLDIAGMAGLCLGGALYRIPVLLDGFISCIAALVAVRLCPAVGDYLLASHVSAEPAGKWVLEALGQQAPIHAEMRLGEGSGAVCAMPLLDLALAVYRESGSFAEADIDQYRPLK